MIILGLVLLVLGLFLGIQLLYILGAIVLVVRVVLLILGATGRAIGGRKHYFGRLPVEVRRRALVSRWS
jgi:hypothetical protein